MKFKKKLPVSYDLEKEFAALGDELKRLIGDSENIKTHAEISDWLVRLYTAAGKLVVAQEICRSPQLKPETDCRRICSQYAFTSQDGGRRSRKNVGGVVICFLEIAQMTPGDMQLWQLVTGSKIH